MSIGVRRLLAILTAVIIIFGWYITVVGIGGIGPLQDNLKLGLDIKGGVYVVMEAQTDLSGAELRRLMDQTQTVIENRVNQMGLSEPVVTTEGEKRLRVELPGAEDAEEAIATIGRTAMLQFVLADGSFVLDGSMVRDAGVSQDTRHGGYAISLEFNREGTAAFAEATRKAYNRQVVPMSAEYPANAILIILDGIVISSPTVNDGPIENGSAQITSGRPGGFPQAEAVNQAALIRGGALPVDLQEITSSTRTATIGIDALEKSVVAGVIGFIILFMIMLVGYRIMGVAANIALSLYVILVLWILVLMGGVLTLPGIAGLILSIGMATDANIIIFSRIREEICNGKTVRVAIQSGFKRAMGTVIDAQSTSMIAALVLYFAGTSSVRGFALMLMIGIIISVFTAVSVTRLYLTVLCESKMFSSKRLFGVNEDNEPIIKIREFRFVKNRRVYYLISIIFITIGLSLAATGVRDFNYGIDFTGGTMMQVDMGRFVPAEEIQNALAQTGINAEIVYAGENNHQAIMRTMQSLNTEQRTAAVDGLKAAFGIGDQSVLAVDQFGPSVSKELRNNAIMAILIASLGMFFYIVFRFEWKFGLATVFGVFHDVLFVLAFYAIFQITINNPFIAGILTVVGYSLNDTIVIFDRIRENLGFMKKNRTEEIVDKSVNQTLTRSIMTSVTTISVMIPLMLMTSPAITEFVLPLLVGVIVGTLSSIGLCSPVYYQLTQLTGGPKYKMKRSKKQD